MKTTDIVSWSIERRFEPIEFPLPPAAQEAVRKLAEEIQADLLRAMLGSGIAASEIKVDEKGTVRLGVINWDNLTS